MTMIHAKPIILCTTDFSESSTKAMRWAIAMAQTLNAHITVLYTYRLLQSKTEAAFEIRNRSEADALLKFSKLENDILKNQNISYDFKIEVGFALNRIEAYALKNNISFLVISKIMSVDNKEMFDDLVHLITIPLVIIP